MITLQLFRNSFSSHVRVNIFRYCINSPQTMENSNTVIVKSESKFIREGSAEIIEPPGKKVFYNPVQEFNRDLSILVLQTFFKELSQKWEEKSVKESDRHFRILEALSATGLRSIRYAKEVPGVTKVIANDYSELAIENMKENVKHNKVENLVETSHSDAINILFNHIHPMQRFQVVDLDPYGSPATFLNTAVQSVCDGGILMVTCTDSAILCGNHPDTCFARYGALSLKSQSMHEMALRIVLHSIQSHASVYKRYIVPILSVSVDFYIRIFVKIYTSALNCKKTASKLSMVYYCVGCDTTTLQPLAILKEKGKNVVSTIPHSPAVGMQCSHCNGKFHMGGPIWSDPIHDEKFVAEMLKSDTIHKFNTSKRLLGMLSLILEELHDVPLYYKTSYFSGILKTHTIPIMSIRSAIKNGGYRVSFSHACQESIKTDAPMTFIWDILKEWKNQKMGKSTNIKPGSPADVILSKPIQHKIDFSLRPDANPLSREKGLTRYQSKPRAFWGPGSRSTTISLDENPKRARNQNKKKRRLDGLNEKNTKEPKLELPIADE